jgi:hypothetical protein
MPANRGAPNKTPCEAVTPCCDTSRQDRHPRFAGNLSDLHYLSTNAPKWLSDCKLTGVRAEERQRKKGGGSLEARYANYLQIAYNREEMVLEFGQAYHESEGDPVIHTRLVTTPVIAGEFLRLLERSVQEYELDRDSGRGERNG